MSANRKNKFGCGTLLFRSIRRRWDALSLSVILHVWFGEIPTDFWRRDFEKGGGQSKPVAEDSEMANIACSTVNKTILTTCTL